MQPPPRELTHPHCFPVTAPAVFLAIAVVVIVVIVVVVVPIVIIANPPCNSVAIANAIAIAAPGQRIVRSVMATALLLYRGDISHG
jgi:hypothetical protein